MLADICDPVGQDDIVDAVLNTALRTAHRDPAIAGLDDTRHLQKYLRDAACFARGPSLNRFIAQRVRD